MLGSCKSPKQHSGSTESTATTQLGIVLLDSTEAASAIVQDTIDGFFEKISEVEISIQMHSDKKYDSRTEAVAAYKQMLQTQVHSYDKSESDTIVKAFAIVKNLMDSINPNLWPPEINLIKVRTDHYGPDVYYTRGTAIAIPDNVFADGRSAIDLVPVMLHEVFHILSRYNSEFRKDMYALIDFVPHGQTVVLSRALEQKRLCNPDGMTLDYGVKLSDGNGTEKTIIPFIISNKPYYSPSTPSFFAYLKFDLYPLEILKDGSALLISDIAGNTVLSPEMQNDYFNHIGDNTQYVIHPDEIMADNFMLAVQTAYDGDYSQYSDEGKSLIEGVLNILSKYKR